MKNIKTHSQLSQQRVTFVSNDVRQRISSKERVTCSTFLADDNTKQLGPSSSKFQLVLKFNASKLIRATESMPELGELLDKANLDEFLNRNTHGSDLGPSVVPEPEKN
jgi:hypothetical protein